MPLNMKLRSHTYASSFIAFLITVLWYWNADEFELLKNVGQNTAAVHPSIGSAQSSSQISNFPQSPRLGSDTLKETLQMLAFMILILCHKCILSLFITEESLIQFSFSCSILHVNEMPKYVTSFTLGRDTPQFKWTFNFYPSLKWPLILKSLRSFQ